MKKVLMSLLILPLMSFAQTPGDLSRYFDSLSHEECCATLKKTTPSESDSPYHTKSRHTDSRLRDIESPRFSGGDSGIELVHAPKATKETT